MICFFVVRKFTSMGSVGRNEALEVLRRITTGGKAVRFSEHMMALTNLGNTLLNPTEAQLVVSSTRSLIKTYSISELVQFLKPVSQLPKKEMLPIVVDVLKLLMSKPIESLSSEDAMRLVTLCGRIRLFDSKLFETFLPLIQVQSASDLRRLLTACNRLSFCFKDSQRVLENIEKFTPQETELRALVIPSMEYLARVTNITVEKSAQACLNALARSVVELKKDEDLIKQKSLVSTDDVLHFVVACGKIVKESKLPLTASQKEDMKFLLTKIVSYDLRSLELSTLLKLFFSIEQLEVFDDFIVRRRLVPAIVNAYKIIASRSPRDTLLVLTMATKLPFRIPLTDDLLAYVKDEVAKLPRDHELYDSINAMILQLSD
jgi:hypothetical protein